MQAAFYFLKVFYIWSCIAGGNQVKTHMYVYMNKCTNVQLNTNYPNDFQNIPV